MRARPERRLIAATAALALLGAVCAGAGAAPPAAGWCRLGAPTPSPRGWDALLAALAALRPCGRTQIDVLHGLPPRTLLGRVPDALPTHARIVALTFDAGADDAGLPRIYATLLRLRTPATFFMTGHFASYYPRWARRVAARFPICNHTMNHVALVTLPDGGVRQEVLLAGSTIRRLTGIGPQPLFRFPYGTYDRRTLRIVNSLGYAAVGWTADTAGWLGTIGGESVATVVAHALAALRPGAIILMHVGANPSDHTTLDADALATVIEDARQRGYRFVTLPAAYAKLYRSWAGR